jgi:Tfp pilus assembly protein PilX
MNCAKEKISMMANSERRTRSGMSPIWSDESGSIMVVAMIILALVTLIGISTSSRSTTEVQIATNNQSYQLEFYAADSGWRDAAIWLEDPPDSVGQPPMWANTSGDMIVKNYGSGTTADSDTSNLMTLVPDSTNDFSQYPISYLYEIEYNDDEPAPGNEGNYRRFIYNTTSKSVKAVKGTKEAPLEIIEAQQIVARLTKIYKIGY